MYRSIILVIGICVHGCVLVAFIVTSQRPAFRGFSYATTSTYKICQKQHALWDVAWRSVAGLWRIRAIVCKFKGMKKGVTLVGYTHILRGFALCAWRPVERCRIKDIFKSVSMVPHYITCLTTTAVNSLFSLIILNCCPYSKFSLVVCDPRTVLRLQFLGHV